MAQQTFSGVPGAFAAGAVLTAAEQELIRDYMIAQIKEGMTGDTGEVLPMIMDLTNNRIVLDSGGLEFSDATTQTTAATAGIAWSGSTANGLGTYGSSSSIVSESSATYDGTTLQLTTSGGGLKLDNLASGNANTLDDYEEGTFTPTLAPYSGTFTLSTATGIYVKVGRQVHIQGKIIVSGISTPTGGVEIGALPFTAASSDGAGSAYVRQLSSASTEGFAGVTFSGYALMAIRRNGATASGDDWANLVQNTTQIFFSAQYVT